MQSHSSKSQQSLSGSSSTSMIRKAQHLKHSTVLPARFQRIALHSTAASIMAFGFNRLHKVVPEEWIGKQFGGHLQYLTIQGLMVSCATMLVALGFDLTSYPALRMIKRTLLQLALPMSMVITALYWPLLFLLPASLIQSAPVIKSSSSSAAPDLMRIPLDIDISLHAAPAITLLLDFLLFETKFSKQRVRYAPLVVGVATLWYACWVEYCAQQNGGAFPYPFLTINQLEIRALIYSGAGAIAYGSFRLVNTLHP